MTTIQILNRIKYFMDFNGWTIYKLAQKADISYSSINNLFTRGTCPSIPTLDKICDGLGITLEDFFKTDSNPLRNTELMDDEQKLVNQYRRLSHYKQSMLISYLTFLTEYTRDNQNNNK